MKNFVGRDIPDELLVEGKEVLYGRQVYAEGRPEDAHL